MRHLLSASAIISLGLSGAALAQSATDPATDPTLPADTLTQPQEPLNSPEIAPVPGAEGTSPADTAATETAPVTGVIVANGSALEAAPGPSLLASQVQGLTLWTTAQPAGSSWDGVATLAERPADWATIGGIDDIVLTSTGSVEGYVADVGGFLGLGSKRVMLTPDQLRLMHNGSEVYFATHFTADELKALPDYQSPTLTTGM